MRKVLLKRRDQCARYRQVPQRHPFKCSARRPSCRCFPDEQRRDPICPLFETDCALVPSTGARFRAPGERRLISSILLPLHFVHSKVSSATTCIRRAPPAALSSLRCLPSQRLSRPGRDVSALHSVFLPNLESANHAFAQYSQAHSSDSQPRAVLPPPSNSGHSSCRRRRSISAARVRGLQPAVSPCELWLHQTWPHPKYVPSTCPPFLPPPFQPSDSSP